MSCTSTPRHQQFATRTNYYSSVQLKRLLNPKRLKSVITSIRPPLHRAGENATQQPRREQEVLQVSLPHCRVRFLSVPLSPQPLKVVIKPLPHTEVDANREAHS